GLAPGSDRDRVAAAAARARADRRHEDALFAELRAIDARPGTVILVPAGTLHAIGGGILLAEIQQPSDCTYRLYDYQSGRELHVDAALDALAVDAQATVWSPGDPPRTLRGAHLDLTPLGPGEHALAVADPTLVVLLAGAATIDDERLVAGDLALLLPGEARISVEAGGLAIVGGCDRARAG
ncbi:MAG: hypothetical protein KC420_05650, partial [Myxococcales bacterium]|nr:hypothetical protein [Myxococcales bacterium]